jgi:Ser/Thr protein kinase RdoA (MazF antagonist)
MTSIIFNELKTNYKLNIEKIELHRDMIGYVFFVLTDKKKYVLKISRPINTKKALQSIEIIEFLSRNDYPVPRIIKSISNKSYIKLKIKEEYYIGCLFEFVAGKEPNVSLNLKALGKHTARLHCLMKNYPNKLVSYGKNFYIDRFIRLLEKSNYSQYKIDELIEYGNELWDYMEKVPQSFCHGDLHSGNIIENDEKNFITFDFDIASNTSNLIDIATLCDQTNFNMFSAEAYEITKKSINNFYDGYIKENNITDIELNTTYHFIAIRHYELIATITEIHNNEGNSIKFLDQQYEWLMKWKNLCYKYSN